MTSGEVKAVGLQSYKQLLYWKKKENLLTCKPLGTAQAPEYEAQIGMCSPLSHILFCHLPLYFSSICTWYPINALSLQNGYP